MSPATLPNPEYGHAYLATLTASGGLGADSFAVTVGTLPSGLSLASDGILSGTPSVGGQSETFTVTATDSVGNTGSKNYTLTVTQEPQAPLVLTSTTATYGVALTLTSSGGSGTGALSYAVSDPGSAGCTIVAGSTTLHAAAAGTCSVTVTKAANNDYTQASSPPTTVTVAKASTKLVATPEGILYRSVSATLKSTTGVPIAGARITFATGGGSSIGAATTNAKGVATYGLILGASLGSTYTAHFGGNADYDPSNGSAKL